LLSIGRLAIGVGLVLAPRRLTGAWLGKDAARPATKVQTRTTGVRDAGIGAATLMTLSGGGSPRPLLLAALAADATDLVVTLLEREHLPRVAVPLIVGAAGSGIALGAIALAGSDGDGAAPVPA
jgi:hypothetical protein